MRERGFRLGAERGGLIPVSGGLMPEIAAKLQRLFDAFLNPKSAPVAFPSSDEQREQGDDELGGPSLVRDDRTADQQRHDVLAAVVDVAARSTEAPTIGGAAPTVLVSVRQSDLDSGTGAGHIDGMDAPISIKSVRQMICTGGTQHVTLNTEGRILGLGAEDRCFTAQQRRAIILRDGGCLIPGCPLPGSWAEIHHVTPDVEGGPTHTDNGVCLCWFHHRNLEASGWQIRMRNGVPELKAPPWIDRQQKWRVATNSLTRMADKLGDKLAR